MKSLCLASVGRSHSSALSSLVCLRLSGLAAYSYVSPFSLFVIAALGLYQYCREKPVGWTFTLGHGCFRASFAYFDDASACQTMDRRPKYACLPSITCL